MLSPRVKTAVLVEDDPTFRELIRYYLVDLGFEVETFSEGKPALEWLGGNAADLVCSDLMLPNMSGYSICEQIKRTEASKGIPVILMSARGMPLDRAQAAQSGADAYLVKPFSRSEFMATVDKLVAQRAT